MQLSQQKKHFLNFSLQLYNLGYILNILKKIMTLIANVFPRLRTLKNVAI